MKKAKILLILIVIVLIGGAAFYAFKNKDKNNAAQNTTTPAPQTHTSQEAVTFVQKIYDDYLAALNKANSDPNNTQPVAQVGLMAVKDNLSADLYAKAAAVTQATPFSCTAQYVTDKYTASLSSSGANKAEIALSISNGGGQTTTGMTATVDLSSFKITDVTCPS